MLASCARSKCTSRLLSMATGLTDACCVPAPPASHVEEGKEENIVGLDIYVTGPASATKAVILAPDIFGWKGPLLRKLADKVASKGYLALVPDYFRGHALDEGVDFSKIGGWLQEYHPSTCVSVTLELIEYLKKTRGIADVGISGFCYGAKVAFIVGANPNLPAKTLVLLHPSLTAPEDFEDLKVPVAILAAESDNIEKFRSLIDKRRKELEIFVKSFKQPHGWTVRYKPSSDEAVKAAEEAHEIMLDWYSKHL